MTLHAAWRIDQEGSSAARTDVSMIKVFGAKVLHDVVDRAVQIHGALGYSGDMPLEMLYRFARHARFVDGADEVHRELVARHALREYSVPDGGVPSEHIPTRREAALRKFAGVLGPEPVASAGQRV
jgi:acyl-CoA dehydrogenase